jgi:hypothetical protein
MTYVYTKDHAERLGTIYTPAIISDLIWRITAKSCPKLILDPCCGTGNLLLPWIGSDSTLQGIEINDTIEKLPGIETYNLDFLALTWWEKPDLILCNPPWNRRADRSSSPERFIRQIVNLFGNKVPTVFICPMGFRLNQSFRSRRWRWLKQNLEITSIITLPLDIFPDTKFHAEVVIFNVPNVKPHYFL